MMSFPVPRTNPGLSAYRMLGSKDRPMKRSLKVNLIAILIASIIGTLAWTMGWAQNFWSAHPVLADALFTIVTNIIVQLTWPADSAGT